MNKDKESELVTKINGLLSQLNQSVDNELVKAEIQKAYNTINKPEKVSQRYKQIPDAVKNMNYAFQHLAVAKKCHFSPEQDKIISEILGSSRGSVLSRPIGVINPVGW